MIPSGLASSVVNRASLGDAYVRVRDSGLVAAVAQFLYDEVALLDERGVPRRTTAASASTLARHRHPRHSYVTGSERQACYDPCRETSGANRMAEAAKATLFRGLAASGWQPRRSPCASGRRRPPDRRRHHWPRGRSRLAEGNPARRCTPRRKRGRRSRAVALAAGPRNGHGAEQDPQPTRRSGTDGDGQAARSAPVEDGRRDSKSQGG